MLKSIRNDMLFSALLTITLSFVTVSTIFYASPKIIAAYSLLPVLVIFFIVSRPFAKIVFPMVMITFPITLQVLGRDAFSTGTLTIFITLAWAMAKHKFRVTFASDRYIFYLLLLIAAIGMVGMITKTPAIYWGPAVRHYLNLISSITVFFLIIHAQNIRGISDNKEEYIEKIISALLLITVLHVFLSFFILNFPWIEKYFLVFLHRTQEHLGGPIAGVYVRATSVFTNGEEFGELLTLLFPFILYKIFTSPKKLYLLVTISLMLGILLSGTRSAFLLVTLQTLVFIFILVPAKYNMRKIITIITLIVICISLYPILFQYTLVLTDRLQQTFVLIQKDADIATIANRDMIWPIAYDLTMRTISLFGHGPIQAYRIGFQVINFHNLYLSLLFQFGLIGSIVFFTFFLVIAKRLFIVAKRKVKKYPYYLLAVTCLLSLSCFLIYEIKFEFNRSDSYQQFVWIFFAVFYLTGRLWCTNEDQTQKQK